VTPFKAFLFDFDGVLADTEPLHWKAWHEVLAPYSPDLDWETYQRRCVGTSDVQMLQFFSQITGKPVTMDEVKALYPQKRKIFQALATARPIVDKGLVQLLAGLKGQKLAVVTSSNQVEVEPILRRAGLLDVLDTVVYGNNVTHYKPDPEPYQLALARLGVQPSDAVVFEDSASGIRSGLDAGCRVVTVNAPADLPSLVETALACRSPESV
jgi:HAD superfamily hydrolase (TIGR01509 family)